MKQFRQPKVQVGPDSWSDQRDDEGDDESMYVTQEENLFQSGYEDFEESEESSIEDSEESEYREEGLDKFRGRRGSGG